MALATCRRLIERSAPAASLSAKSPCSRIYWEIGRVIFDESAADWLIPRRSSNGARWTKGPPITENSAGRAQTSRATPFWIGFWIGPEGLAQDCPCGALRNCPWGRREVSLYLGRGRIGPDDPLCGSGSWRRAKATRNSLRSACERNRRRRS